jgi:hypothetical protein
MRLDRLSLCGMMKTATKIFLSAFPPMQKRMHLNAAVGSVNKINNMRLMINIQRSVECHNRRA